MPFESDAQFFKKIGNAIKSAANSVANKADCWFSTGPCDGGFMSCKIKIDKGGGNYTGGWARQEYPMTVFNTHDDISLDKEINNLWSKIDSATNKSGDFPKLKKYYYNVYKKIYNNASTILDPTNCPAKTNQICEASRVAKNAAFVNLVNFDKNGAPLQNRQGYKDKAIQILEQFNTPPKEEEMFAFATNALTNK